MLERVPKLVDSYQAKRADFISAVRDWILESEKIMLAFGFPQVAELAGLRSFLTAAEEGIFEASFNIPDKMPRYRARAAVGVQALDRAAKVLQEVLGPEVKRLEDAKQILTQALVMSGLKEPNNAEGLKKKKIKTDPKETWHRLWNSDNTRTLMQHVLTFVSYDDARELTNQVAAGWFTINQ